MEQTDEPRIGDETWDAVYDRVAPRLAAYCRRRLPEDEADDAVSETLARAVAGRAGYRERGLGIDAWLFGICRNVVLDAQRRQGRRSGPRARAAVAAAAWRPEEPGPLDSLLGREEAAVLRVAFARLSEDEREVLELRVVGGLDAEAVAEVLGKRPGAVRMAQSRALGRLRTLLAELDGEGAP